MGIFTVVRHTRDDEEQGRLELVGATAVGRQAAAGRGPGGGVRQLPGAHPAHRGGPGHPGLPGGRLAGPGRGGRAVPGACSRPSPRCCAQLTVSARTARGMAIGVLGLAFLLRAVGDAASGTSWLRWASPLGWAEQMQVYASPRWMVGALFVRGRRRALAGGAAAAGGPPRPGRRACCPPGPAGRRRPGWLRSPLALAWRLQRGALLGWVIGFVAGGRGARVGGQRDRRRAEHQPSGPADIHPARRAQRSRRCLPRQR